jgi:hypothetical protein
MLGVLKGGFEPHIGQPANERQIRRSFPFPAAEQSSQQIQVLKNSQVDANARKKHETGHWMALYTFKSLIAAIVS